MVLPNTHRPLGKTLFQIFVLNEVKEIYPDSLEFVFSRGAPALQNERFRGVFAINCDRISLHGETCTLVPGKRFENKVCTDHVTVYPQIHAELEFLFGYEQSG